MPGRKRVPSFKLPSGTTAERDGSYNLTTVGNIFYNTDTSNVEIRHEDPTNNTAWRDLVMNNKKQIDISGNLVVDGTVVSNNKGIVQVKSTSFTGTESGNADWEHIEDLDVTITPSSSSNKIFLKLDLHWSGANDAYFQGLVYRSIGGGSDTIVVKNDGIGYATECSFANRNNNITNPVGNATYQLENLGFSYLDSPNTNAEITYKIKVRNRINGNRNWYINYTSSTNDGNRLTGVSTFTAFEVIP